MAWWTTGHNHPNEVYRVLDPIKNLLQGSFYPIMEFREKMLPYLPIEIYALPIRLSAALGMNLPHHQVMLLRFCFVVLSMFSLALLYRMLREKTDLLSAQLGLAFYALFLPLSYWQIHFLSGEMETHLFIFSVYLASRPLRCQKTFWHFILLGGVLGLAFWVRYQSLLWALPLLFFMLKDDGVMVWLKTLLGGLAVLLVGGAIDWFHGNGFLMPPIRYFLYNIVQGGASRDFGADPFYRYFIYMLHFYSPPLFLFLLYYSFFAWRKEPRGFWGVLIYFIVHSLIGHKEERFIMPVEYLLPYLAAIGQHGGRHPWSGYFNFNVGRATAATVPRGLLVLSVSVVFGLSTYKAIKKYHYGDFAESCSHMHQIGQWYRNRVLSKPGTLIYFGEFQFSCGTFYLGLPHAAYGPLEVSFSQDLPAMIMAAKNADQRRNIFLAVPAGNQAAVTAAGLHVLQKLEDGREIVGIK